MSGSYASVDLAGNLTPEAVGQPNTQNLYVRELDSTTGVSGAALHNVPTLIKDNVAGDNQTQNYLTAHISTTAEPAGGVG